MFGIDSGFHRICTLIYTYVMLNLLFLLACVPVVTIPTAVAALFAVARKIVYREEPGIWKTFWRAFRENIVQASLIGGFFMISVWIMSQDIHLLHGNMRVEDIILSVMLFFVSYGAASTLLHAYSLMVHFRFSTWQLIQNAMKMNFIQPHLTLFSIGLTSIFLTISVKFPFLLVGCFFSLTAVMTYWFIDRKLIKLGVSICPLDEAEEEEYSA